MHNINKYIKTVTVLVPLLTVNFSVALVIGVNAPKVAAVTPESCQMLGGMLVDGKCKFPCHGANGNDCIRPPAKEANGAGPTGDGSPTGKQCGDNPVVKTSIDLGCKGKGNPITDLSFAIIRLLSDGVGLVIVGGLMAAGIQFTMSRGDPQLRAKAIGRISHVIIALFIYIFSYAIINYVVPQGFFK